MKLGDLVKTKVPGFGTGQTSRMGIIVNICIVFDDQNMGKECRVLEADNSVRDWYDYQLKVINESR